MQACLSQQVLALAVGISRQALIAIEAGRQVPSTAVALRLARRLGCRVEDLFSLGEAGPLDGRLIGAVDGSAGGRVLIGRRDGAWVCHALGLTSGVAADGLIVSGPTGGGGGDDAQVRIEPLLPPAELERNVLVAGCAPLLGALGDRMGGSGIEARQRWIPASSTRALEMLARGAVHIAGTHLRDSHGSGGAEAHVRRRFRGQKMWVANLVGWRAGLVLPPGNPLGIAGVADLLGRGAATGGEHGGGEHGGGDQHRRGNRRDRKHSVRIAWREQGAGAQKLLLKLLRSAGATMEDLPAGPIVRGHMEVAQAVVLGAAGVGMSIEAAALAYGLDFLPLCDERFDLVLSASVGEEECVRRLLDAIDSPAFRRDVAALGGYDTADTGHVATIPAEGPS